MISMAAENTKIQKISLSDLARLQKISRQTFSETFAAVNSESNMKKYLEENFSSEKLGDELQNPDSRFYFVLHQNRVVGYLKVNAGQAQTEPIGPETLEIERIYVLKEYHGKNIGRLLLQTALQMAEERNAPSIWLGVWEHNHRALNFYKKNGFAEFGRHIFRLGDDVQTDLMMRLDLGD